MRTFSRLVGFPGRLHRYDNSTKKWKYVQMQGSRDKPVSLVLTGAAFYHRYFNHLYTHSMPQTIRDKVDALMNCEDLAMNFLVSHVTRKPPLKVAKYREFPCQGCQGVALSRKADHAKERDDCVDSFAAVYGYMPLVETVFRIDAIFDDVRAPT